jgi:hypothetical protein
MLKLLEFAADVVSVMPTPSMRPMDGSYVAVQTQKGGYTAGEL